MKFTSLKPSTKPMKRTKPLRRSSKRMRQGGLPAPTKAEQRRMDAIPEAGCVVARARGYYLLATRHHLTVGSRHGAPRRGHRFTVALSEWSHLGRLCVGAWTESEHREHLGPSYAKEPAAFRREYPDDWLLEQTDKAVGWQE